MIVETEVNPALYADTVKKRKIDITENDILLKKRKLDVNNGEDVSIIEDNATDVSAEKKTSCTTKCKSSTDDDCMIVYDEGTETT